MPHISHLITAYNNDMVNYEIELISLKMDDDYIELNSNVGVDCEIVRDAMERDHIPIIIY